jgi:6-phosphogluconolactonase
MNHNIQVFRSLDELSAATATFIIDLANKSVSSHGRFTISLSGGSTPEHLYTLLSTKPFRDNMPWKDTFIFWGDERCVPLNDKDNNAHTAMILLLDKVAIPPANINRIPVDLPPDVAAKTYEQMLKKFFGSGAPRFDLILLGLGENGHTASLFPATDVLNEKTHWVKEVYVAEQKMFRVTMTIPVINMAQNILFLVSGAGKADILKCVLSGNAADNYPAQLIEPVNGSLYWFVDSHAASLLSQTL